MDKDYRLGNLGGVDHDLHLIISLEPRWEPNYDASARAEPPLGRHPVGLLSFCLPLRESSFLS